jgi:hypothetical protein
MTEVSQFFWSAFFHGKSYVLCKFNENGLGYILGEFSQTPLVTPVGAKAVMCILITYKQENAASV